MIGQHCGQNDASAVSEFQYCSVKSSDSMEEFTNQNNEGDEFKKYYIYTELPLVKEGDYRQSSCIVGNIIRFHFLLKVSKFGRPLRMPPIKRYKQPFVNFAVIHRPFIEDDASRGPIPKDKSIRSPLISSEQPRDSMRLTNDNDDDYDGTGVGKAGNKMNLVDTDTTNDASSQQQQQQTAGSQYEKDLLNLLIQPSTSDKSAIGVDRNSDSSSSHRLGADGKFGDAGNRTGQFTQSDPSADSAAAATTAETGFTDGKSGNVAENDDDDGGDVTAAAGTGAAAATDDDDELKKSEDKNAKSEEDKAAAEVATAADIKNSESPRQRKSLSGLLRRPESSAEELALAKSKPSADEDDDGTGAKTGADDETVSHLAQSQEQQLQQQLQLKQSAEDAETIRMMNELDKETDPLNKDAKDKDNDDAGHSALQKRLKQLRDTSDLDDSLGSDKLRKNRRHQLDGGKKRIRVKKYFMYCEIPKIKPGEYRVSSVAASEIIHTHFLIKVAKDEANDQPTLKPIKRYRRPRVNFAVIHRSLLVDDHARGPIPISPHAKSPMIRDAKHPDMQDDEDEGDDDDEDEVAALLESQVGENGQRKSSTSKSGSKSGSRPGSRTLSSTKAAGGEGEKEEEEEEEVDVQTTQDEIEYEGEGIHQIDAPLIAKADERVTLARPIIDLNDDAMKVEHDQVHKTAKQFLTNKENVLRANLGFNYGQCPPKSKYELISQWELVSTADGRVVPELVLSKAVG